MSLRSIFKCIIYMVTAIMGSLIVLSPTVDASPESGSHSSAGIPLAQRSKTVLAVGGSSAYGWDGSSGDSYLKRALDAYGHVTNVRYIYDDHTVVGGTSVSLEPSAASSQNQFSEWLQADRPRIVMISWGLLDDTSNHTPMSAFQQSIRDEILDALSVHATVLVVTPPVVGSTAGGTNTLFNQYLSAEHDVVTAISDPNVHWLDLYTEMSTYIANHGGTLQPYYGDGWHPNLAGQELAGQLLFVELEDTFGHSGIVFKSALHILHKANQQPLAPIGRNSTETNKTQW